METVGKQVQVVSGLGVGGPVGPDLHHHHHSHPHPLGSHGHGHSLVSTATNAAARAQAQTHQPQPPLPTHNQHLPARSTPVQLHRPSQNYVNIKSSSPVSPRNVESGATYVQSSSGGSTVSSASGSTSSSSVVAVSGGAASLSGQAGRRQPPPVAVVLPTATGGGYTSVPVPGGLRYDHPYLPPPTPSASVNQTPPPSGTAAYTRDAYRNATSNVNERVPISVSSSPVSQMSSVGMPAGSEYVVSNRADRPRISLLPSAGSVAPSASPTAPDYHSARSGRSGIITGEPYRSTGLELTQTMPEAPPFKKIRLGQPTQQAPNTQPGQVNTQGQPSDNIKQEHVQQLPQPLRIDTRPTTGAYTPKTEAISPTLPEPTTQEETQYRSSKDDLLQQISKVDREIAKRESTISKLRKKLIELEENANKPLDAGGLKRQVEEQSQPKHQSLMQKIYADNRKKAEEAHRLLDRLGLKIDLPLYNQPSDTNVYQENRIRHQTHIKTKLIARLRKEHAERASQQRQQSQTYAVLVQEWHRKVERLEAGQKRKTKEAKNREFFEKVFPELRKQREDKERFNRVGARIKSEADLEEIMDGLQEQEMEDKKMRSYAVIPPLLIDSKQRRLAFQNKNGLLQPEELETLHNERKLVNAWSPLEHEIFKEKYLQHPKNFVVIAQSLEHKSVADCVQHYYLTKKAENYKGLLRKSRRTRQRNNTSNKVNNSNSTIGPIDILTTGVTTRLQREQQQKTQENPQTSSASTTANNSSSTTTLSSTTTTTTPLLSSSSTASTTNSSTLTTSSTTTTSSFSNSESSEKNTATTTATTSSSTTSVLANTTTTASTTTTSSATAGTSPSTSPPNVKDSKDANKENKEIKEEVKEKDSKDKEDNQTDASSRKDSKTSEGKSALSSSSIGSTNVQMEKDKKKSTVNANAANSGRAKDKKKDNHAVIFLPMETSDEEAQMADAADHTKQQQPQQQSQQSQQGQQQTVGPHTCSVCQGSVEGANQSRPLLRSQATLYGLREDQVSAGARVCNTCRCKAVRGRYTSCPLPGCPNLNNVNSKTRVKRLRALPAKWLELPAEIRDPVIQEFQIPSNTTKCCSACFNRISRRLAPHLSGAGDPADDPSGDLTKQWSDEELELLKRALRENGTNWSKVSETIPGKSNHQCKSYYLTYRKKLGLDQVVAEYYQSLGEERRPCLTDEEESGSSTSSCDEMVVHDSSDTASAGSPVNTLSGSTMNASVSSSNASAMPASYQQSAESKTEKISEMAVVSLVPPTTIASVSQAPSTSVPAGSNKEDYDSSATTADEGQGGTDMDSNSVLVTLTTTSNSSTSQQSCTQPVQTTAVTAAPPVQSPPSIGSNANPLTVKDLMLGFIEMQLKKHPNSPASSTSSSVTVNSGTPTISSILQGDNNPLGDKYTQMLKSAASVSTATIPPRDSNLATLSVVSGPLHTHRPAHPTESPQQINQMQATITPCPPSRAPPPQSQPPEMMSKDGLVVMQVQQQQQASQQQQQQQQQPPPPQQQQQQQPVRETEGTLDLSIKKPRQQEYNHMIQQPQIHKSPSVTMYRPEPPPGAYYHPHAAHSEQGRGAKSPLVFSSSPRPQTPLTPKLNKVVPPPPPPHPKVSPKLSIVASHKGGSITHGTPVSGARYDGLLRMTPPGSANSGGGASSAPPAPPKETGGSITQGTPVHLFDKRAPIYDYHRSMRHSPVTSGNVVAQSPGIVVSHSGQYNSYPSRPPPVGYTMEQQMSSRQIIMNDYITSQQMHPRGRASGGSSSAGGSSGTGPSDPVKTEAPSTLYYASTPPPPQSHTQPRQGVIQRHNTQKPMHYPPPPPGLEAFSSLVDIAVQQPSLPVPHSHAGHPTPSSGSHEGLGKTMADRLMADRYVDNNRAFREQEMRIQEQHRIALQQAEHRMAVAHQRERDFQHIREKEEHRLREKELQQLEHRIAVQQQQQHHHQREKEMQEHRLQQREKELQNEHRIAAHQQREKEMQQQMAAAAAAAAVQREKEHQERLAQQREKEIQQQREKDMQHQHMENRMAQHQRDFAHLRQQQQLQQHIQQNYLQQRMEAERRHMAQIYRDQQMERDASRMMSASFATSSRIHQMAQQGPPQSSSRGSSSSNQHAADSATMTAASLIDAIITHQINQSAENINSNADEEPKKDISERLFQGLEANGVAHSPVGENNVSNRDSGSGGAGSKGITLGEHVDHIVTKDFAPPLSSYRPYQGYDEQWKRRKVAADAESSKSADERQIIRVAQQQQQQQQQQPSAQQLAGSSKPSFHSIEPVSPPDASANHYARRFYETTSTASSTSAAAASKSHLSPLDYVKNKIVEVMRTSEDDKGGSSERNGAGASSAKESDKDDKANSAENPTENADDVGAPPAQSAQPPPPAPTTFYPFSALGVHTGPPPAPPPQGTGAVAVKPEQMQAEPAPLLSAQYEPLSDED